MLCHTIAGVGVCRFQPGRTEKQHNILAGKAQFEQYNF
jgi:hypothetical protein